MVATMKKEEKRRGGLGEALAQAGVLTLSERLTNLSREAWKHRPADNAGAARRKFMHDALSSELTYALMMEWKPQTVAGAIGWVLERAGDELRDEELAAQQAVPAKGSKAAAIGLRENVHVLPFRERGGALASTRGSRADQRAGVLVKAAAKLSMLDKFFVNGMPVGDCTPEELEGWASSKERDTRFVRMLAQGMPAGRPIRDSWRGDEVDNLYALASEQSGVALLTDDTGA